MLKSLLLFQFSFLAAACSPVVQTELKNELMTLGITQPAIATATGWQSTHLQPDQDAFVMVATGQVNEAQINSLFWLTWPQSHEAMTDLLGYPAQQDDHADYYTMPNGHGLTVYYNGGYAFGYSLGDSGGKP